MSQITNRKSPLDIAILGTRGVPASYGGFETFAEQLSVRLAARGHRVTVYGRAHFVAPGTRNYKGVAIRVLPSIKNKHLETVSHTALSVGRALFASHQVLLICNAVNSFLCPLPRLAGQKVVLNVDGIERRRKKWSTAGRVAYRFGEFLSTVFPDVIVADARVIQDYYMSEYGARSRFIPYGAPIEPVVTTEALEKLGVKPGQYLLYVSRLEPENNADLVIEAYRRARVRFPLVLVGDAPYATRYKAQLQKAAAGLNIIMPGSIYGPGYRELLSHNLCYIQATEVGGTHPALLEAMGAGSIVLANDTPEHREVMARAGILYRFNDADSLAVLMRDVCESPAHYKGYKCQAVDRVREAYDWDVVTDRYEDLFRELLGES